MKRYLIILFALLILVSAAYASTSIREAATDELVFYVDGNETIRIDDAGRLGVKNSDPSSVLDVGGDLIVNGTLNLNGTSVNAVTYVVGQEPWWNSSFTSRLKIAFDNSASPENLVNFTLLVVLNDSNINYNETQDNGADIRFVDKDNSTLLDHEIEEWNETGNSYVWVEVPQIDALSTTDHVWLYYNNWSVGEIINAQYDNFSFDVSSEETLTSDVEYFNSSYYVTGTNTDTIYIYATDGTYTGTSLDVSTQVTDAAGLVINSSRIYVLNSANDTVSEFNLTGDYMGLAYRVGTEDSTPQGLATNGSHFFMVGDTTDDVFIYNETWNYTGTSIDFSGHVSTARDVAVWDNIVYVLDSSDDDVHGYYVNGTYADITFDLSGQDVDFHGLHLNGTHFMAAEQTANAHVYVYDALRNNTPNHQNAVWDGTYKGVWHLNNDATAARPQFRDSTISNFTGNATNNLFSNNSGFIGDGISTRSTGQIAFGNNTVIKPGTDPFTISLWIDGTPGNNDFIINGRETDGFDIVIRNNQRISLTIDESSAVQTNGPIINAGDWNFITAGRNSTHHFIFVNGTLYNTTVDSTLDAIVGVNNLTFGSEWFGSGNWEGSIDEVRYNNVGRSQYWINAEYLSQSSQFNTYSDYQNISDVNQTGGNISGIVLDVNGTDVLHVTSEGNVGIGVNNPRTKLAVSGNINASGSINAGAGLDLAEAFEAYESLKPGDIVAFSGPDGVTKATDANAFAMFGVVSTSPGMTLNKPGLSNVVHVALIGRVPVNVKGRVAQGDYITVSSTPGVGESASKPGFVVGRALEGGLDEQIVILVEPRYFSPQIDQNNKLVGDLLRRRTISEAVEVTEIQTENNIVNQVAKQNNLLKNQVKNLEKNGTNVSKNNFVSEQSGIVVVLQ